MPLAHFHPFIAQWFRSQFAAPTDIQEKGWESIATGGNVLITAPTGSGKTLAAFLFALDSLVRQAAERTLEPGIQAVYVSPLKALSNDIRKNLEAPLAGIASVAAQAGADLTAITTAARTGDTLEPERRRMVSKPPHILVTTPESLFILMTSASGRRMLATARTLIFDEIHATAGDKRGAHLSLTLARLDRLAGRPLQRIGLSATVSPIEEIARFLGPGATIVESGRRRPLDLAVITPAGDLGPIATTEAWASVYDQLSHQIQAHRTSLIFVNTRRLSERVTHHLTERLGPNAVLPHHGSLARELRLNAEDRLKKGELGAVVATASLELGIDVGSIDLVCQIGSPRSLAAAVQRVGRSGHWYGGTPKGRFVALTRDDLIEAAALVRAMRAFRMDRLELPRPPRDILAQQIVAMAACEDWAVEELFTFIRTSYSFRNLERQEFDAVVTMLAEGVAASHGRRGAWLHYDRVNGILRARRGARLSAITSGGAIPENAQYRVVLHPEGVQVGTLDEDFAVESMAGDVFLLGSTSWRIVGTGAGVVHVQDAQGAAPSIPFWLGEAPGRTRELSEEVARLRSDLHETCRRQGIPTARDLLLNDCGLTEEAALQAIAYVEEGARQLSTIPDQSCVVAERFFDDSGGMQLVIHAPFGSRINRAWGLALRKRFCRGFNFELQAAATDNGLVLSLTEQHSFPLELVFRFLASETTTYLLTQGLLATPFFGSRWRWNATRSLAVLRFAGGRKIAPPLQRMRADDLLAAVFPDQAACAENLSGDIRVPDHPLIKETIENCLHEAMDLDGLLEVIRGIEAGRISMVAIDTPSASVFSHEILHANPYAFLDDAPLEERRSRAVQLRQSLPNELVPDAALDEEVAREVAADAAPTVRDAEELHDALLGLVLLPPVEEWREWHEQLSGFRRAGTATCGNREVWVAAERLRIALKLEGFHLADPTLQAPTGSPECESEEDAAAAILRGWLESCPPVRAEALSAKIGLRLALTEQGLARLEASGEILRGAFTRTAREKGETEWVNRRLLARIYRATLAKLRREIEPASPEAFLRFLARWQHVLSGSQLHGPEGLHLVIRQFEGLEAPATVWEKHIFPARVAGYESEWLDRLCFSGEVTWARLSPHPAFDSVNAENKRRRIRPTRAAPVAIFTRESADWLAPPRQEPATTPAALSSPAQTVLSLLERHGASFFRDLERRSGLLPSQVEDGLWELVAAGLAASDGFASIRALTDPKRRKGEGKSRQGRPRYSPGRWSLVQHHQEADEPVSPASRIENFCRLLLHRWGVLFRDLLKKEPLAPPWRDLLPVLRRMELAGVVRGGRFLSGSIGEQFALPEAVDLLRGVRRDLSADPEILLHPADTLNLTGIIGEGEKTGTGGIVLTNGKLIPEYERTAAVRELLATLR